MGIYVSMFQGGESGEIYSANMFETIARFKDLVNSMHRANRQDEAFTGEGGVKELR